MKFISLGVGFSAACLICAQAASAQSPYMQYVEEQLDENCGSPGARIAEGAESEADLDGDGRPDLLFDWGKAECVEPRFVHGDAGGCGMQNCAVDVYLSSRFRPGEWPEAIFNLRERDFEVVRAGGLPLVKVSYMNSECGFANICESYLQWDGENFARVEGPQMAGGSASGREMEITAANLVGNWDDVQEQCRSAHIWFGLGEGGVYTGYEESGSWRLIGDQIAIMTRKVWELGEEGSEQTILDPEPTILTVRSLTADRLVIEGQDGSRWELMRCD